MGDVAIYQENSFGAADAAGSELQQFISVLMNIATGVNVPGINDPNMPNPISDAVDMTIAILRAERPSLSAFPTVPTDVPSPPDAVVIDPIPDIDIPVFSGVKPVLVYPAAPDVTLPPEPGSGPTLVDAPIPNAPVFVIPQAPNLAGINIPTVPSIQLPTFVSSLPVDNLEVPPNNFNFTEEEYQSVLLTLIDSKLVTDIGDGTYGINTDVEQLLSDRARDRAVKNAIAQRDEISRIGVATGFDMPTGSKYQAEEKAIQDQNLAMNDINREIYLDRTQRFVQAGQFALSSGLNLEQTLITYHTQLMERTLRVQQAVLEAGIAIYNTQVVRYNARLDAYKTEAQVYSELVRAALAEIEIYRTEMEGARLEGEVQSLALESYNSQINGVKLLTDVYRTQMDAAKVFTEIQRSKMDGYRAQVSAYEALLKAGVSQFDMYRAEIDGETAKVDAYRSETQAFTAEVNGARAAIDAQKLKADAQIDSARLQLEGYGAEVDAYKAEVLAVATQIRAVADSNSSETSMFGQLSQGILNAYNMSATSSAANLRAEVEIERMKLDKAKAEIDSLIAVNDVRLKAGQAGADGYGKMILGAMSGINSLAANIETQTITGSSGGGGAAG